jgi:chromosome segregation ATPase
MANMDDTALLDIANRLYALPFDEFVAARTAAAKDATAAEQGLQAAVRALPKPSVAAWAVNMLAIHQPDILHQLAGLGERMRTAQSSLDALGLRELGRERRALLAAAVDAARSVSGQQGRGISDTIAADVERTLRAMTADEGAAAAVQSGRLLQSLSADGVDTVDLSGAVAVPEAVTAARSARPPGTTGEGSEKKPRSTAERTARRPADKPRLQAVRQTPRPASPSALEKAVAALSEARAAEEESARLARERREQLQVAETELSQLAAATVDLRARLKASEEQLERARKRLDILSAEAKQSARAADKAQRSAVLAHERVLRLGNTRD